MHCTKTMPDKGAVQPPSRKAYSGSSLTLGAFLEGGDHSVRVNGRERRSLAEASQREVGRPLDPPIRTLRQLISAVACLQQLRANEVIKTAHRKFGWRPMKPGRRICIAGVGSTELPIPAPLRGASTGRFKTNGCLFGGRLGGNFHYGPSGSSSAAACVGYAISQSERIR